jgi:hypothetical protein
VNSKTIETLVQKSDRVVALADQTARDVGYGAAVTDQQRVTILTELKALVDAFEQVGGEVEAAIALARTFVDVADGSTLAQTIGVIKARIEAAAKREAKAKQDAIDRDWRTGSR